MLVNFFIVGAPKAGTTSLFHYLTEHPQVFMSELKETNYFSSKELKEQGLYYDDKIIDSPEKYNALFKDVKTEKAIGEASVSYLFYPVVPKRIFDYNPKSKIIIILRNPADRALSHYNMDKRLGFVNESLENIFRETKNQRLKNYYQQFIQLGLYTQQVKNYLDVFGDKQVKIFWYEELQKEIKTVIKALYEFLEVDSTFEVSDVSEHNAAFDFKNPVIEKLYKVKALRKITKAIIPTALFKSVNDAVFTKKKPAVDAVLKNELKAFYKPDVIQLEKLLNKNLSAWYQ